MNWEVTQQALEVYLAALNTGLEFDWENTPYNSTPGVPFAKVLHVPVNTEKLTVGTTGVMNTEGIMIVGLNYPAGEGSGPALSTADKIARALIPGTSIPAGGGDIVIRSCTMEGKEASSKPDWWVLPVLVHYNAYHNY